MIVMTMLVRDEEDILAANLEFHLEQGVDFFVVTENRSVDTTPEILAHYEAAGLMHVIREKGDDYRQREWVTRMARLAATQFGADWVINSDADEFWWPTSGTLRSSLADVPPEFGTIAVEPFNFPPTSSEGGPFFERMILRDLESCDSLGRPMRDYPKVCHRAAPDVVVRQGNHRVVDHAGLVPLPAPAPMIILHFPLRSYSQFERKISNGGSSLLNNPAPVNRTWRMLYEEYLAGRLRAYYEEQIVDPVGPEPGAPSSRYVIDNRLRDYIRTRILTDQSANNTPAGEATTSSTPELAQAQPAPSATRVPPETTPTRRVAILIVNGFRPRTFEVRAEAVRYPWIQLCLSQLRRRSAGLEFEIHVFDNAGLPEHKPYLELADRVYLWPVENVSGRQISHRQALDALVEWAGGDFGYLVFMDSDAVPLADDWLHLMIQQLEGGAALVGVWRDEMAPTLRPFVHPSCMCIKRSDFEDLAVSFGDGNDQDVGQSLTDELIARDRRVVGLHRTNAVNAHFLIGGIYGDLVYHHGAGSRPAKFWTTESAAYDEYIRLILRDAAFRDFDHLIDVLRGKAENDIWDETLLGTRRLSPT